MSLGAILGVVGAAIAGLVTLLVARLTKPDPTAITSADGKPLHWPPDRLPLLVLYAPHDPELAAHIEAAVNLWNLVVGRTLLITAEQPDPTVTAGPGVLTVTRGPGRSALAGGHTKLRHGPGGAIIAAPVVVSETLDPTLLRRVVAHEIGHVLGLDHDSDPTSVMYPQALPGRYVISARDAAHLKSTYGSAV